jgi:hypothetical protein
MVVGGLVEVLWCPPRGRVSYCPEPGACLMCVGVCLYVCYLFILVTKPPPK